MSITAETRRESYQKTEPENLYKKIISVLAASSVPLSARQVATILFDSGNIEAPYRGIIQPRLTELIEEGEIVVCGKIYDELTKRNVAIYKLS